MSREKRYSELTTYELNQEIASLREKARKAEQMGMEIGRASCRERV